MGPKYRVNRLHVIGYKNKKQLRAVKECQFLAKSQISNCIAKNMMFKYVNFWGSHFKKTDFLNSKINGCDFWGVSFNKCKFKNTEIIDSVFMACRFEKCTFEGCKIENSTIVNTSLDVAEEIEFGSRVEVFRKYPECELNQELIKVLDIMKLNALIRKCKLLHLPGNRYNMLNIYLLQRKFGIEELPKLLSRVNEKSYEITTYKNLENILQHEKRML